MSDRESPETLQPSEQRDRDWLCDLLDEPERAVGIASRDETRFEAGVRCEYLAVFGLLGESVEPAAVPRGLGDRVLAAARAGRPARAAASGFDSRPAGGLRGRLLPLAAALAIGATGLAAWQTMRLGELRSVVARQAEELESARETAARLASMEAANDEQAAALALLTSSGSEFCPLRPPALSPMPEARGALAMSPGGDHWYLRVVGLEPRDDLHEYRLWFLRDGEPMAAAVLPTAPGGGAVELMDGAAPEGFNAVVITLEPVGSVRPSGPRLLFGNERMRLL